MDDDFPYPHLDASEVGTTSAPWQASNVILVEGQLYTIENYQDPYRDGSRLATLVPYDPEKPF